MNTGEVPAHEMKLGALVVLLFFTLLCGFAPLCFVRGAGRCSIYPETRHRIVSLVSCFTGGVFLATCLLDLVPDYLNGINDAFRGLGIILQFPLPEFIIAMGFFLVLVLEQIVLALKSQSTSHSEGLAVGLQQHSHEVLQKCVGLLLHKSIISFSLALKLTQGKLRRAAVLSCLLLYAIMSPLGIVLGIAINDTKLPSQHHLAKSTLEGLASGTFMYITFMEILPHELSSQQNHMNKVAMLLSGFAVVTGVLFIKM